MDVVVAGDVLIRTYESDFTDDFWAIFNETFYPNYTKAVRSEGYTERAVPNYNFGEFRSQFRLSPKTYEELIITFTFSGRHVERFGFEFSRANE